MTMLEGILHYSPQTQNRKPENKILKCNYPAFCRVKEQHCVIRSDGIQISWFYFHIFLVFVPSVALVLLSWVSFLFFFELLIYWDPSALLFCVCPPRSWAVTSCLRQCWLYNDLPVKFWLCLLHCLCCQVSRLGAVLMHTQVVGPYQGHSTRLLDPGSCCTESGLSLLRSSMPGSVCYCCFLLSQNQIMRLFVHSWPQLCDFHSNIKWLTAQFLYNQVSMWGLRVRYFYW